MKRVNGVVGVLVCPSSASFLVCLVTFDTKLVIETVVEDKLPSGATGECFAGLDGMFDALKIVIRTGSGETEIPASGVVTVTDECGGSTTQFKKTA